MYTVLVCDDEKDIVTGLTINLMREGYQVLQASNGKEAVDLVAGGGKIDLIIMDIMMPVMNGIEAMINIRKITNVPVIMLSAKAEDSDKVTGLNVGADDYVTKPFNSAEVLARVKAQIRRYNSLGGQREEENSSLLVNGGIEIDDVTKKVTVEGEEVNLTPKEYDILKFFMKNPGKVFSPKEIYREVWENDPYGAENTVTVHIRHLREKVEINPAEPRYIKVSWGRGYKMESITE